MIFIEGQTSCNENLAVPTDHSVEEYFGYSEWFEVTYDINQPAKESSTNNAIFSGLFPSIMNPE